MIFRHQIRSLRRIQKSLRSPENRLFQRSSVKSLDKKFKFFIKQWVSVIALIRYFIAFHGPSKLNISEALSYTASSYTGLADARFLIGFKKIWDVWIHLVKTISCSVFWSNNSSYTNFDLHRFLSGSKNCASQGLTVNETISID